MHCCLIGDLEGRAVLRPRLAMVVDARRRDVGVAEPFLDLGDVRLMIERVRCRCGAQAWAPISKPSCAEYSLTRLYMPSGVMAFFLSPPPRLSRSGRKQRTGIVLDMPGLFQIVVDQVARDAAKGDIEYLLAIAGDFHVRRAVS
jgi:hypothetical protein